MARRFGLEVEYGGSSFDSVIAKLNEHGLSQVRTRFGYQGHSDTDWVVKADGSVAHGGELVSPPLDFDDPDQRGQVDRAFVALREAGARTEQSAGIHVHVDVSDLTWKQVQNVVRLFVKFEDVLYRLATSGWRSMRPRGYQFCPPLRRDRAERICNARSEDSMAGAWYGTTAANSHYERRQHGHGSRYCGINLASYYFRGTIEFRLFNSSMNAERVQAYIAICVALVEDARRGKRRSINQVYPLGGMVAGTTNPNAAYHRFQQVVRYDAGMDLVDYKRMNKIWKDSLPQANFTGSSVF